MTKTVDVAAGQKVASTWGNEVRDRSLQVFATAAERDAQWPTAPVGAHCVTLDTNTVWLRITSSVWRAQGQPVLGTAYAEAIGLTFTTVGLRDVLVVPVAGGSSYPFSTVMSVQTTVWFGGDSGVALGTPDMTRNSDGAATASPRQMSSVSAGNFVSASMLWGWTVPAGQSANYKVRYIVAAPGGTTYVDVRSLWSLRVA
jgi:hypothetical protein